MTAPRSMDNRAVKPLGIKSYGSIGHLPGSRLGPGDHHCHEGQARICTIQTRDRHDVVIVQEKLDGSCVSIAKVNGEILALGRAGYLAQTAPYEHYQRFAAWVRKHAARFDALLHERERLCGEWLLLAHGTRYELPHEPFVAFDLFTEKNTRTPYLVFLARLDGKFVSPREISIGPPRSLEWVRARLNPSGHGALDPVEGGVWRVERRGLVDFLAKWLRPDKVDGCYLPEISNLPPIWQGYRGTPEA